MCEVILLEEHGHVSPEQVLVLTVYQVLERHHRLTVARVPTHPNRCLQIQRLQRFGVQRPVCHLT